MKFYLDLDGVLVDFEKGFHVETGHRLGSHNVNDISMDDAKIISNDNPRFWHDLPWTSDGKLLWNFIKNHDVEILTARAKWHDTCVEGKYYWCAKNLGMRPDRVNVVDRSEKQRFARKKSLLIDDYVKNCREFVVAGGNAIIHYTTKSTIDRLGHYLD